MGADPLSWGAMGLMAANTVAGGIAGDRSARAAKKNAERQADYARAEGARQSAEILQKAKRDKQRAGADFRRARSKARVGATDSGVSLASGSAMEILANAAANHALNQSFIDEDSREQARLAREGGMRSAYGYEQKANALRGGSADNALQFGQSLLSMGSKFQGKIDL